MSSSESSSPDEPRLFGISNANRHPDELWGKNSFNNAFPVALSCYMWAQGIQPVYIKAAVDGDAISVENTEISVGEVFNAPANTGYEDLHYEFETKYEPYFDYVQDPAEVDNADVVISNEEHWLRPLQIKLTVVPDQTTCKEDRQDWAPELVFRPADSCACALGIFDSVADHAEEVKAIFREPCANIQHWDNRAEINSKQQALFDCVENFLIRFQSEQQAYILHPIWMTEGKSPVLADQAFDMFVWSDFALIAAYLTQAKGTQGLNRATRAVVRFARAQYELSTQGKIHIQRIYREMDYGSQTDKELSITGKKTQAYMPSPRRTSPILPPSVLSEIILNGGHRMLSPERRFDQTLYFTAEKYFKTQT